MRGNIYSVKAYFQKGRQTFLLQWVRGVDLKKKRDIEIYREREREEKGESEREVERGSERE